MSSYRIASAIPILENLVTVLDSAYWEANSLNAKDAIYDSISAINCELSELNKLSIQDHDLLYEPISIEFKLVAQRVISFRKFLDSHVMRSNTLSRLDQATSQVMGLVSPNQEKSV